MTAKKASENCLPEKKDKSHDILLHKATLNLSSVFQIPYLPLYNTRPCIVRTPKFQTKFFFVLLNTKGLRV